MFMNSCDNCDVFVVQVGYGPQYGGSTPQGYVGGKPVYPPTQQPLPSPTFGPGQRGPAPPYNQQNHYMNPHPMNPQAFNRQPGPNPAAYNNQFQQQQHSQQQSYQVGLQNNLEITLAVDHCAMGKPSTFLKKLIFVAKISSEL